MQKHPVYIFMPDWVSEERQKIIKLYGANIKLISRKEGGFKKCIEEAEKFAKENNYYYANQFNNSYNVKAHYETTGEEIIKEIKNIEAFVSGYGTGGTITGIGRKIKEKNKNAKIYAIEPEKMPMLKENKIIGSHKIEGIGDEIIPEILDEKIIDEIILIKDGEAINMARKISKNLGIGVGISSGANFLAAVKIKEKTKGNVVTIFADDNKKYLSTDLTKEENSKEKKERKENKIKLIKVEIK